MGIAELAKKVDALEADLAAKSSRIADLEARVSLLEIENVRLRKAVVSDGDEEEGVAAVEANKVGSTEEGVPTVPTPVKRAVRVATATRQSDDEVEIMDAEGGGGGDHGSIRSDTDVALEDDDVSITPRGKKRAATQVVSDSEDEENDRGHGNQAGSRKRALRGVSDSESEKEEEGLSDSESEKEEEGLRIADLEARVSLLEIENVRLRKAVASDGDEEEGVAAVEANKVGSTEEGVPAVPTPVKRAVRVVTATRQSDDEVEIMDAEGGGGGDHGSIRSDTDVALEDDDVSITPRGKKRAATQVVSDSEDEENDGGHGNQAGSRKRALRGVSDSESEKEEEGLSEEEEEEDELYKMEGCSTPTTRHSAPARLGKSQSKRMQPARRALDLVEPKDHDEESEDGSEEDDSMDEFIDDADCSENSYGSDEESSAELEQSDNEENYGEIMDRIRGKKNSKNKGWEVEAEMLPAFDQHPELTLKAVCALYRKQTEEEKAEKATIVHNKRGFSQIDAPRGSHIAQFLLDDDAFGPLKKTTQDLEKYDRYGLEFCHKMAFHYSKQLFAIYQNKEDPYFP